MQKSILVVDDHSLIRMGIRQLLSETSDLRVSAEASSAEEALEKARATCFDAIILDIILPGRGGLEIIRDLKALHPGCKIIALSSFAEDQLAIRCYREGADAYICKGDSEKTLVPAIRTTLSGRRFVSRETAERLVDYISNADARPLHERLTKRELQILMMIGSGWTPGRIAAELSLSVKTINSYRARMLEKMNFSRTPQLVRYAVENHLLQDQERMHMPDPKIV